MRAAAGAAALPRPGPSATPAATPTVVAMAMAMMASSSAQATACLRFAASPPPTSAKPSLVSGSTLLRWTPPCGARLSRPVGQAKFLIHRLSFVRRLRIDASSSVGPYDDSQGNQDNAALDLPKEKRKASLQAIAGVAALVGLGTLGGVALTLSQGGPAALMAAIAKSGFSAAFALIFVSEIGDKTFFIAALLAMRHSRFLVLLGATGALSLMTVISVVIGRIFQSVPAQLQTTLPIGEYAAVALLIWFGFRSIKAAWDLPSEQPGTSEDSSDSGELAEAQEFLEKSETKKVASPLEVVTEAFSLVFVAEWGDRSMLATVALGAAQSPWGVATGAIAGHVIATALAVLGGAFLAQYISEKVIGYTGGVLFLVFAAATLLGVF